MTETKDSLLENIQNFQPTERKKVSDAIYKASVFFVTSNKNDDITEPEILDSIMGRISSLVALDGKTISEDMKRKVSMQANDLNNKVTQLETKIFDYKFSHQISKESLYLFNPNKIPQISDLKRKEVNYFLNTPVDKLHGMYSDWVNVKLYEIDGEKFIRIREFFKPNYFKENYLSSNFRQNYEDIFGEEISIREHKHTDDSTVEYSLRLQVDNQEELEQKTKFITNYIKSHPRMER